MDINSAFDGALVQIDFLDHREISADPHDIFEFSVVGRVRRIDELSVSVDCWFFTDTDEDIRAHNASNVAGYCIVKTAIKRIRLLGFVEIDDDEPPPSLRVVGD